MVDIFESQMEANEFLMYIADTFRESLGKSTATSHLLNNDFIKKFIDIYQADPDRQREIVESVREWHERNKPFHLTAVRSRKGDETEAKKLEYFDELIIASFT